MRRLDSGPGRPGGTAERPALFFADAAEFHAWLAVHHDAATELWMGLYKKHVADRGLIWADAVEEALCFGWIDSQTQRIDADATRQRWTPRKPGSSWSAINVAAVERLTALGRMQPAGLAAYAARRSDRTASYAHEQGDLQLPEQYAVLLAADPPAARFLAAATPAYRKTCIHWVTSAKQQATRDKRMAQLMADSAAGRLIPPERYGDEPKWVQRARSDG